MRFSRMYVPNSHRLNKEIMKIVGKLKILAIYGELIMGKDILTEYKMNSRDEAVKFLKSLWLETPQSCPLCGGKLDFLHKKTKKSNCDWV